jgi:hypothetical protein
MRTKVAKKSEMPKVLSRVRVPIPEAEFTEYAAFFGFKGMKAEFLADRMVGSKATWSRRQLDEALRTGTMNIDLLKDVRRFVAAHRREVAEFSHATPASL